MTGQLFDVDRTTTASCPICHATREPDQERAPKCAHDLEREGPRPRGCLNAVDPARGQIPF